MIMFYLSFIFLANATNYVFTPLSKDYSQLTVTKEIKNLPTLRTQDSIGDCHATASAYLIDEFQCRKNKTNDCAKLTLEQRASILDLTRLNVEPSGDKNLPSSYQAISKGGWIQTNLNTVFQRLKSVAKESCAPLDILNANPNDKSNTTTEQKIAKVKLLYEENMDETVYDRQCAADEVKELFPQAKDVKKLADAFIDYSNMNLYDNQKYLQKNINQYVFFYKSFYPESCNESTNRIPLSGQVESWPAPTDNIKVYTNEEYENKIIEILNSGYPIGVDGICCDVTDTVKLNPDECEKNTPEKDKNGFHSFVITGIGKRCNSAGQCRQVVKVSNTWGDDWQKSNDDGWVDLKTIVYRLPKKNHITKQKSIFSWIRE